MYLQVNARLQLIYVIWKLKGALVRKYLCFSWHILKFFHIFFSHIHPIYSFSFFYIFTDVSVACLRLSINRCNHKGSCRNGKLIFLRNINRENKTISKRKREENKNWNKSVGVFANELILKRIRQFVKWPIYW